VRPQLHEARTNARDADAETRRDFGLTERNAIDEYDRIGDSRCQRGNSGATRPATVAGSPQSRGARPLPRGVPGERSRPLSLVRVERESLEASRENVLQSRVDAGRRPSIRRRALHSRISYDHSSKAVFCVRRVHGCDPRNRLVAIQRCTGVQPLEQRGVFVRRTASESSVHNLPGFRELAGPRESVRIARRYVTAMGRAAVRPAEDGRGLIPPMERYIEQMSEIVGIPRIVRGAVERAPVGRHGRPVVAEEGMAERDSRPTAIVGGSAGDDTPSVKGGPPWMPLYQKFREQELSEKRVVGLLVGQSRQPMEQGKHAPGIDRTRELSLDVLAQLARVLRFRIHHSDIGVASGIRTRNASAAEGPGESPPPARNIHLTFTTFCSTRSCKMWSASRRGIPHRSSIVSSVDLPSINDRTNPARWSMDSHRM